MPDNKVTFESNGTWHRVGDVDAMDVAKGIEKPAEEQQSAKQSATTAATSTKRAIKNSPPKPGTFSLSSLKSSVAKATPQLKAETMETPAPEPEPVVEEKLAPAPVEDKPVEAPKPEPTPVPAPVEEKPAEPQKSELASIPIVEEPKQDEPKQEEPKSTPVPKPKFNLSSLTGVGGSVGGSKSSTVEEIKKQRAEEAIESVEKFVATPAENVEPVKVDIAKEIAPKPIVPEEVEAPKQAKQETESIVKQAEEVHAMNLAGATAAQTTPAQEKMEVPASQKDLEARIDDSGVQTFNILALDKFLSIIGVEKDDMVKWAKKCVSATSRYPATIFAADFNSDVRFYNYFSVKGGQVGVIIGAKDAITCAKIGMKIYNVEDFYTAIHTDGVAVVDVNGDVVALFSERLRKAVTL